MPQMSPMFWSVLYIIFIMILIMITMKLYFTKNSLPYYKTFYFFDSSLKWMW
uniref:ATP synthase 8 n=1 Tax=Bragasellus peltatus TaxID=1282048 RepID=A0A485M8E5_9CRUS|nr:ATP synthase 8 [Bragasellus peltatus]